MACVKSRAGVPGTEREDARGTPIAGSWCGQPVPPASRDAESRRGQATRPCHRGCWATTAARLRKAIETGQACERSAPSEKHWAARPLQGSVGPGPLPGYPLVMSPLAGAARREPQAARSAAERGHRPTFNASITLEQVPIRTIGEAVPSRHHGPQDAFMPVPPIAGSTTARPGALQPGCRGVLDSDPVLHGGSRADPRLPSLAHRLAAWIVTRQGRDAVLRLGKAKPSRARLTAERASRPSRGNPGTALPTAAIDR